MKQRTAEVRTDYGQPSDRTTDYGQHTPKGGYLSVLTTDSHGQNYGQSEGNPGGPLRVAVAESSRALTRPSGDPHRAGKQRTAI